MKRLLPILLGCLILALPSCEIPFPLDQDVEPRIYLQCIGDGIGIRLMPQYAVPVSAPEGSLKNLQVDMQVNGLAVTATEQADGSYYCSTPLKEGDLLEVSVRADGVAQASGRTRAPYRPAVQDVKLENVQVDTIKATRVSLTLDHAPGEGEYFGIQILASSQVTYMDGTSEQFVNYLTPGYILSAAESGNFDLEDFVQVNYDGITLGSHGDPCPITLVTRKQFEGAVYNFYLNSFDASILNGIRGSMPGGNTGVIGGGIISGEVGPGTGGQPDPSKIPASVETLYYVSFSGLSSDFYNYAKALYQSNFDFLSNMGLTPANFTWSNVTGGLGFVGAIATTRLDAIEIPQES